ncbi:MAG: hypothetical protein IJH39_02430 [Clostridia bacterium]|nr:hypothetical protein [Clostridia bacterium]
MNHKELMKKGKDEFLKNLNEHDFKGYVDLIIQKYYKAYVENDSDSFDLNKNELEFIVDVGAYPNLENYIYSRLLFWSNKTLYKIFDNKRDLELISPVNVDLNTNFINAVELFDVELIDKILEEEENAEKERCLYCEYYKLYHDKDV